MTYGVDCSSLSDRPHDCLSDLYFTTALYPVVVVEEMASYAGVLEVYSGQIPQDFMVASAALTGGTLEATTIYGAFDAKNDELISGASLTGGELVVTTSYGTLDAKYDELASAALLTGGTMETIRIQYDHPAEDHLTSAGALTGGSLV